MQKKRTIGFMFKQINNVYEKEFNNRLRTLGITASQCAVLDYLFDCEKEEVTQKDIEKRIESQKSYRDRSAETAGRKGIYLISSK